MTCRIVSLPERGSEPLVDFYVRPSAKIDKSTDRDWDRLLQGLVERSLAVRDRVFEPELFLFFLGDQVRHGPDLGFLADLLDAAHSSCLGSSIYLVSPTNLLPRRAAYLSWLEIAIEHRAVDLLQIQYSPMEPESISSLWCPTAAGVSLLEEACGRADSRLQLLRKLDPRGRWNCYTRQGELPRFARLLRGRRPPSSGRELPGDRPEYLLVVACQSEPPNEQMWLVEDARAEFPQCELLVATLPPLEPSDDLRKFCKETVLHHPLSFSGELELWFLYRRLRMPSKVWPLRRLKPEEVDVGEGRHLAVGKRSSPPTVLFTCAWGIDEAADLQRCSQDLGALVSALPLTTRYDVDPTIGLRRLSWYLAHEAGSSLIWIHMGPSHAEGSIADVSGQPWSPEDWLNPFLDYEISVPLALFLCQESTEIARRFAEAGAGITIGFDEKPLAGGSRRLAIDILRAAVRHGLRREAILRAFDSEHLDPAGESSPSQPTAFVSRLS